MAAFHGLDGFALAVVAIDTLIAAALLAGFTQASAWLQGRVVVGLALFVPSAVLLGDFLGAITLLALLAGQFALVTPELRKILRSRHALALGSIGFAGGFGLCVAHGLGLYAPIALVPV